MSAAERYQSAVGRVSDIRDHLPGFVDLIVRNGFTSVIELGVRSGTSTAAWLWGLEQTGGHLWAVDVDPAPFFDERMTFIQGSDLDPAVYAQLPDVADVVFVDTSHTFEQTVAEIDLYLPRARSFMLFHDTDSHPTVRAALNDRFGDGWSDNPACNGLGTVTL